MTSEYKNAKGVMEEIYVGRLSSNTLEFLWHKNLSREVYKERLLMFNKFFATSSFNYFILFPEEHSQEEDIKNIEEPLEYFSASELYMRIPCICYDYNKEIKIDSALIKMYDYNKAKAKHYFTVKSMQCLISNFIKEKLYSNLIQAFTELKKCVEINKKLNGHSSVTNENNNIPLAIAFDSPQVCIHNEVKEAQGVFMTEEILELIYNVNSEYTFWALIPTLKLFVDPTDLTGNEEIIWPLQEEFLETIMITNNCEISINPNINVEVMYCRHYRFKV